MKKLLLCIVLAFISMYGNSQKYLTNRDVYNFKVGDIFESRDYADFTAGTWYMTVILSEHFSAGNDTLFFSDSLYSFAPKTCLTCDSSFSCTTENHIVTNLDSSSLPSDTINISCSPYGYKCHDIDTIMPYCTTLEFLSQPDNSCDDSCDMYGPVGPTTSMVYKGVPYVYYHYYDNGYEQNTYYSFLYYKKGDTVCGFYYYINRQQCIPIGIAPISAPNLKLNIFPNPATTSLSLKTNNTEIYKYEISDISGRLLLMDKFVSGNPIDISELAAGQYIISFYTNNTGKVVRKFSKQ